MTEPSEAEETGWPGIALYIDSSALAKLYVPEAESERLDAFLRGKLGLMISELAITEVLSAVARRKRDGELKPELHRVRGARHFVSFFATAGGFVALYTKRPFIRLKWPGAEQK
jgi:predicted nucleic acid-binding protein